jgi:hypothetical protein
MNTISTFARSPSRGLFALAAVAAVAMPFALAANPAHANERRFTYTYESNTLAKGAREVEVWSTWRKGRDSFYSRLDQRIEFEWGLTDRLQTAVYLNFSGQTVNNGMGALASSYETQGVSSEWKYKVMDRFADAFGLALYGEFTYAPKETEFESKLIFDKQVGKFLFAANLVGELELEAGLEPNGKIEREKEFIAELDAASTYFLTNNLSLGLELRSHNIIEHGEYEKGALFAGPVVAYAADSWWVAFSALPQLTAMKKDEAYMGSDRRELTSHEKWNARLLFSFHL